MVSHKNAAQLRAEKLGKKRQQVSELAKSQKRTLSDLYYLSLYPKFPISKAQLDSGTQKLSEFLDVNDLVKSRIFSVETLPTPESEERPVKKARSESLQELPAPKIRDGAGYKRQSSVPAQLSKLVEANTNAKVAHAADVSQRILASEHMKAAEEQKPKAARTDIPKINRPVKRISRKPDHSTRSNSKMPNRNNPRFITFTEDKNSDLMLFVVPDRLPEPPQSRRPLTELYYTTQTLPLAKLLPISHKALTTDDYQLSFLEGKLSVVYSRIEELKRADKWSLRQPAKLKPPYRPKTHWDHLIDEAKWMQTDFREERKLKISTCYELANAIDDYWSLGKEACCVKYKIRHVSPKLRPLEPAENVAEISEDITEKEVPKEPTGEIVVDEKMTDAATVQESSELVENNTAEESKPAASSPTELAATVEPENVMADDKKIYRSPLASLVPIELTPSALEEHHFNTLFKTHITETELNSLSKELFSMLPQSSVFSPGTPYINDFDNLSLTSVTKFLSAPDLGRGWQRIVLDVFTKSQIDMITEGPNRGESNKPDPTKVSVFGNEHQKRYVFIKAPQPPNLKYLEFRTPTIWLPQDDTKLLRLVKEFSYNWEIVSIHMLPNATCGYVSNIERRTPWQCFERWHQLTPNFSLTDLKGPYAQQAQIWLDAAVKAQAITKRRISPLGVGVDSIQRGNRRLRWASMFDAIRKSMRKKENAPRPNNSIQRKSQITESTKLSIATPAELSKMKYERDKSITESYHQHQWHGHVGVNNGNSRGQFSVQRPPSVSGQANGAPLSRPSSAASVNRRNGPTEVGTTRSGSDGSSNGMSKSQPSSRGSNGGTQDQLDQLLRLEKQRHFVRQQAGNPVVSAVTDDSNGVRRADSPTLGSAGASRSDTPNITSPDDTEKNESTVAQVLSILQQSLGGVANNQNLLTLAGQIVAQHPDMPSDQIAKLAQAQIQRYVVQLQQKYQQQQQHQQTGSVNGNLNIPTSQAQALLQRRAGQAPHLTPQQQHQQIMQQVMRAQQQQGSKEPNRANSSPPSSATSMHFQQ